jgi:hypothetical protein
MSFTDFKEVTANNPGTTVRYGGNDLKEFMQILNGKVVATRRPKILNEWIWLDHFDMSPPATAPGNPTDTNSSRFYIDPTDFKLKIKKTGGTIIDVENVSIPDSALSQITNKAKLPSSVVYNDQNNNLGDFYLDFGDITAPANPSAGVRRLFVDQATGELSVKTSAGTSISLETQTGGGGGGDVFLNQANTFGDFNSTFRSSRLLIRNPANTFSYTLVGSAIAAGRNITLPLLTGNDTLVTEAFAQTLTNKTIAAGSNTISGITDATIATHTTTKITTASKSLLNTAIVYNDQTNTFGAFDQIFKSSRLLVRNPADTFSYTIAGGAIAAARTLTLPLLTGNDIAVTEAFTQTVTNKTINTTDNTLTATTQATGDILKNNGTKFVRMARGTALQVLRTNSGATDLEFASLDSERIGKSTASGNGTTTVFNIAHGVGSNPTYAIVSVAASGSANPGYSYTTDATNIVVTFSPAPTTGTNNVVIYWIAVA